MSAPIFDEHALALRRRRALRAGPRLFLAERAIEDLAERLSFVQRRFGRALLIGCPDPALAEPLAGAAEQLVMAPTLQEVAGFPQQSFDLLLLLGQLDTANELRAVMHILRAMLVGDGLFAGCFPGNNSLPVLRTAMLAADRASGLGASPRTHPRIEASAVAGLLEEAGFAMPVVDIDRVRLSYRRLDDLVADLRGMGATNVLTGRSRTPLSRAAVEAARAEFVRLGDGERTTETVELINFAAWTRADA